MYRTQLSVLLLTLALTGCGHKPAMVAAPPVPVAEQVPLNASVPTAAVSNETPLPEIVTTGSTDTMHANAVYNIKQHVTYAGPHSSKKVALTFDDGPDAKYTQQIIDILKKEQVSATFFVIGEHAAAHPEMMKQIASNGHEIGNHSWDHTNLSSADSGKITEEINKTDEVIERITGQPVTLMRPPYGALSKDLVDIAETKHRVVCWSVDTRDWEGISADKIVGNVKKEVKPGAIILQHSAGGKKGNLSNTVAALPSIIHFLKEHGYELVTVSELMEPSKG